MHVPTVPLGDDAAMELRHLLSIAIDPAQPSMLGDFPMGDRRLITFRSGTFEGIFDGAPLRGALADGGVDWQTMRGDGAIEIDAHYLLRTDQDEPIEVRSIGLRVMAAEVAARMAAGEVVDPSEYYFRTHIRLHTSTPRLARLNRTIFLSSGERRLDHVAIHIHEVS